MQAFLRLLATTSVLLSPFMAQASDTKESRVIDTDEGGYITTVQQSDRGMFLDVSPADKNDNSLSILFHK